MAAAAVTVPLGLLHMRPLQHWLYGRIPTWVWKRGTYRVQITPACRKTFRPWSDPSFLRAGVPLEQVSRHAVVFTDASTTGWGATYNRHAVSGVWTGPQLHWHINCLELLAVRLALSRLRGRLQRKDVLVRTDNTATVAYINRQGGLRSHRMSQLARHLLLWSQKHLRSLRAIHIPRVFNRAADELSRAALPGEWRLNRRFSWFGDGSEWIGLSGEIPIRRSSDVASPFPPSGNEGYIRNQDVRFFEYAANSAGGERLRRGAGRRNLALAGRNRWHCSTEWNQ